MPELRATISANNSQFIRKLDECTEKAREFATKTREVTKDILKDTGGSALTNLLGFGGLAAAATTAGVKIVEAGKEGLAAFSNLEQQTLSIKNHLSGVTDKAEDVHEILEKLGGVRGPKGVEEMVRGFNDLRAAGLSVRESIKELEDLQKYAIQSGKPLDDLAESFAKVEAGGLEAGEGASKLLKTMPGLAAALQPQVDQARENFRRKHSQFDSITNTWGMSAEDAETYKKLPRTAADYVKSGQFDTQKLEATIHRLVPKDAVKDYANTLQGHKDKFDQAMDQMMEKVGGVIAPAFEKGLDALSLAIPDLTKQLEPVVANLVKFWPEVGAATLALIAFSGAKGLGAAMSILEKLTAPAVAAPLVSTAAQTATNIGTGVGTGVGTGLGVRALRDKSGALTKEGAGAVEKEATALSAELRASNAGVAQINARGAEMIKAGVSATSEEGKAFALELEAFSVKRAALLTRITSMEALLPEIGTQIAGATATGEGVGAGLLAATELTTAEILLTALGPMTLTGAVAIGTVALLQSSLRPEKAGDKFLKPEIPDLRAAQQEAASRLTGLMAQEKAEPGSVSQTELNAAAKQSEAAFHALNKALISNQKGLDLNAKELDGTPALIQAFDASLKWLSEHLSQFPDLGQHWKDKAPKAKEPESSIPIPDITSSDKDLTGLTAGLSSGAPASQATVDTLKAKMSGAYSGSQQSEDLARALAMAKAGIRQYQNSEWNPSLGELWAKWDGRDTKNVKPYKELSLEEIAKRTQANKAASQKFTPRSGPVEAPGAVPELMGLLAVFGMQMEHENYVKPETDRENKALAAKWQEFLKAITPKATAPKPGSAAPSRLPGISEVSSDRDLTGLSAGLSSGAPAGEGTVSELQGRLATAYGTGSHADNINRLAAWQNTQRGSREMMPAPRHHAPIQTPEEISSILAENIAKMQPTSEMISRGTPLSGVFSPAGSGAAFFPETGKHSNTGTPSSYRAFSPAIGPDGKPYKLSYAERFFAHGTVNLPNQGVPGLEERIQALHANPANAGVSDEELFFRARGNESLAQLKKYGMNDRGIGDPNAWMPDLMGDGGDDTNQRILDEHKKANSHLREIRSNTADSGGDIS